MTNEDVFLELRNIAYDAEMNVGIWSTLSGQATWFWVAWVVVLSACWVVCLAMAYNGNRRASLWWAAATAQFIVIGALVSFPVVSVRYENLAQQWNDVLIDANKVRMVDSMWEAPPMEDTVDMLRYDALLVLRGRVERIEAREPQGVVSDALAEKCQGDVFQRHYGVRTYQEAAALKDAGEDVGK
jgi:hypothetical protein